MPERETTIVADLGERESTRHREWWIGRYPERGWVDREKGLEVGKD